MSSNSRYSMLDSMDIRCARCGYENNPQFRFCGMCGSALRPRDPEVRDESRPAQTRSPEMIRTEPRVTPLRPETSTGIRPEVPPTETRPNVRDQIRMAEPPMDTDLMAQVLREQNTKPPVEPMPSEPLIAELTAAQKVKSDQARDYSRESREDIHEQEVFHGERTPIPVTGPSFLGLSQNTEEKGFEYLLEDEPHPGRFRTLVGAVLLIALAAVGFHYWQKAGYPGFARSAQSSATKPQPVSNPSAENSDAASETAPTNKTYPAAPEPDKSSADESNTISSKADADLSAAARANKTSTETALPPQPAPQKPAPQASASVPSVKPSPAPRTEIARAQPARVSPSRPAPIAPPNPAEDSLYLEGQKYLYGGGGVAANCGRAQQYLTTSANNNNSKAQSTLGTMYATGHCVRRDLPLAYRWFARALHADPRNTRLERDVEIMWNQMSPQERSLALKNN
jgi:hypothetical protein